jgi:glucosylceramidase
LSPARQAELLRAYFDPNPAHGHGYTLCRVHMNSCDFALGNYAHADLPGDVDLHSFNIDRDRQALLPMIHGRATALAIPNPYHIRTT